MWKVWFVSHHLSASVCTKMPLEELSKSRRRIGSKPAHVLGLCVVRQGPILRRDATGTSLTHEKEQDLQKDEKSAWESQLDKYIGEKSQDNWKMRFLNACMCTQDSHMLMQGLCMHTGVCVHINWWTQMHTHEESIHTHENWPRMMHAHAWTQTERVLQQSWPTIDQNSS